MEKNSGDTQARFFGKEPGPFLLAANCANEHELQKALRRRFAQMNADSRIPYTVRAAPQSRPSTEAIGEKG